MTRKPDFIILAGPNGAGKSTNGHFYVPVSIPIFNGDLVLADLIKKYPTIEPDRLHGGVAVALEAARDAALAGKKDFAFESNYSSDMATDITTLFKDAGYQTTLIYFGLDNLTDSAMRVKDRVETGGHNVPPKTLQYNFEEGIKRVNKDLSLFDTILFVDGRNHSPRIVALIQKTPQLQVNIAEDISWYSKYFHNQIEALNINKKQQVTEIPQERKKRGKRFRW